LRAGRDPNVCAAHRRLPAAKLEPHMTDPVLLEE
jgi:hypothetical protein